MIRTGRTFPEPDTSRSSEERLDGSPGRAAIAAAVVGGESLSFAANGFRCPLTDVAESLGAEDGSVTDIFLPRWFAHDLPVIHVPLILLTAILHRRNLRQSHPR